MAMLVYRRVRCRVDCWWCSAGVGIVRGMDLPCHLADFFRWLHGLDSWKKAWKRVTSKTCFFFCLEFYNKVVVSNIFYFHPYLGKIPILTNIFQMGWNHQLDKDWLTFLGSGKSGWKRNSVSRSLLAYDQKLATGFPIESLDKEIHVCRKRSFVPVQSLADL